MSIRLDYRTVPPFFVADYCLRCCRPYRDEEWTVLVAGTSRAKYRAVAIEVGRECVDRELDHVLSSGIFRNSKPNRPPWHAPRYYGHAGVAGYAKLSRLDSGMWRLGFHRGHVEVWTKQQVEMVRAGRDEATMGLGYARDYSLYGPVGLLGPQAHRISETHFVDLSTPTEPPDASPSPGEGGGAEGGTR